MSEELVGIDPRFVIMRRHKSKDGKFTEKPMPLYAGVLDAAMKKGLKSLTTRVVQLPSAENGHYAVVTARAEFEDGRVFEELADASPQSVEPMLHPSMLRMAATRAKGRALRDAINCSVALLEEMPPEDAPPLPQRPQGASNGNGRQQQPPPPHCQFQDCGAVLTRDEINAAIKYAEAYAGGKYCTEHGRPLVRVWKETQRALAVVEAAPGSDPFEDE